MEVLDVFRERLKSTREQRGWSQGELAERTKLPPSSISHFENGPRKPSFDNLKKIAEALNVTTDFLLGRSDKPEGAGEVDMLARKVSGLPETGRAAVNAFIKALEDQKLIKR